MDVHDGFVGFVIDGPGLLDPEPRLTAHMFDLAGGLEESEIVDLGINRTAGATLAAMNGRPLEQTYHELCLVQLAITDPEQQLSEVGSTSFRALRHNLRHKVLRELRQAGFF